MSSIRRAPRRENHTICTALAPEAVFTVRTYATPAAYEPRFSAQISAETNTNQQVKPLAIIKTGQREPSQVLVGMVAGDLHARGQPDFCHRWGLEILWGCDLQVRRLPRADLCTRRRPVGPTDRKMTEVSGQATATRRSRVSF